LFWWTVNPQVLINILWKSNRTARSDPPDKRKKH
jgi:hypothetical protein